MSLQRSQGWQRYRDAFPEPDDNPTTPEKVELGKKLFFDPRLSGNNEMSCCHVPLAGQGVR